jgi:hypothetical protein
MVSGFDNTLIGIIRSHPSIIVGTCDRALGPAVARGFGARVIDGGEAVEVVVSRWPGPQTEANLEATGRLAVTFTAPETFDSYQIKGRATAWGDCTPADLALVEAYTAVIRRRIAALGEPAEVVDRTFTARSPFRVRFAPEVVFLQTPGRNAGQRL